MLTLSAVNASDADDPDAFKCWLSGGMQELGEPVMRRELRFAELAPLSLCNQL